jgi:hypothetical protein
VARTLDQISSPVQFIAPNAAALNVPRTSGESSLAVLDNLPAEDDIFCLFDRESRALDVIGEIRFEGCEVFACDAGRRGVRKLRERAAVSGSASEFGGIEGFQATIMSNFDLLWPGLSEK